jgi:hypothetical protein
MEWVNVFKDACIAEKFVIHRELFVWQGQTFIMVGERLELRRTKENIVKWLFSIEVTQNII